MAISPDLPGVSVAIFIDGHPLPERDMPDADPEIRTVNRLVEAQSDKIFKIRITTEPHTAFKGNQLRCKTYVDGALISSRGISVNQDISTVAISGFYIEPNKKRKCKFLEIREVENHSRSISRRSSAVREASQSPPPTAVSTGNISQVLYTGSPRASDSIYSEEQLEELGTIRIVLFHANIEKESVAFSRTEAREHEKNALGAQEKAMRSKGVYVGFTEPVPTKTQITNIYTDVANVPQPAATFIFHYRSKEGLDSMQAAIASLPSRLRSGPVGSDLVKIEEDDTMELPYRLHPRREDPDPEDMEE